MKISLFALLLSMITGCSMMRATPTTHNLSFNEKKNCSPKSYEFINKRDMEREKHVTLYEHNQLQTRTVDFFLANETDLKKCYEDFTKQGNSEEYHVCIAIGVNVKSKPDFVEASDEVNKLDQTLKACLEKKLSSYDYKKMKAKHGTKFILPLKLMISSPN